MEVRLAGWKILRHPPNGLLAPEIIDSISGYIYIEE